jgi:1-aminocyclopropane-1-carboxylate deaminase
MLAKKMDLKQSVSSSYEELQDKITENPTLLFAQNCGMQFEFISREGIGQKSETSF